MGETFPFTVSDEAGQSGGSVDEEDCQARGSGATRDCALDRAEMFRPTKGRGEARFLSEDRLHIGLSEG